MPCLGAMTFCSQRALASGSTMWLRPGPFCTIALPIPTIGAPLAVLPQFGGRSILGGCACSGPSYPNHDQNRLPNLLGKVAPSRNHLFEIWVQGRLFLLTDFELQNRLIFVVTTRHRASLLRKAAQRNLRNLDERLNSLKGADWHTSTLVRSSGTVHGIPHGARIGHGSAGSLAIQTVLFAKCTTPGNGSHKIRPAAVTCGIPKRP